MKSIYGSSLSSRQWLIIVCITALVYAMQSCSGTLNDNTIKTLENTNPNGRNDAWGFAGYGGGGAMFYPAVSPHNHLLIPRGESLFFHNHSQ